MKYKAIAVVSFGVGSDLGLTKPQADARSASLRLVDGRKGWYATTAPVQLKAGEEFQYEGVLPKGLVESLEEISVGAGRRRAAEDRAAADREAAEKAEAERRAAELQAKRDELQQHIAALETAVGEAETDEAKALIQQQLDEAKAELQALE